MKMGKQVIYIPENQLKSLYENQKLSISKLAKLYNCGETTVQRRLHKYNIRVRPSMSIKLDIPIDRIRFLYGKKRKSTIQLAKIYSCSWSTILNRLREHKIKIRDTSEAHIKYPKNDFSGDLIEKAYLIGFRLGDLHVRKYEKNGKVISVECASTKPEQIRLIRSLFKKYGYVRITPPNRRGIIRVQCSLDPSFKFLLKKEDKIESLILSDDKLFSSFFAGYLDAEGDIGIYSRNTASLRVGTYDKNILSQIQKKLSDNGIRSRLTLDRPKGSKVNLPKGQRSNKEYKTKCDFWRLAVYRKKDLLALFIWLAPYFRHPRIKKGLLEAKRNIFKRNQDFGNLRMN